MFGTGNADQVSLFADSGLLTPLQPPGPRPLRRVCKCVFERMEGGKEGGVWSGVRWGGRGDNCNSFCVGVFVCKRDWEINYMR